MPHATADVSGPAPTPSSAKSIRKSKSRSPSRDLQQLHSRFEQIQSKYSTSAFSASLERQLRTIAKTGSTRITRVLSLGLGSLVPAKSQTRRLKQLAIFLALADTLERITSSTAELYAQDPEFSRTDEAFLASLGVGVVRTPSGAELGEAGELVDAHTLVYSPFLTLEAYEQLLVRSERNVKYLVGDDFNALLAKWPKHSAEREQVERVMRVGIARFRRRAVDGEGFWEEEDRAFAMAVYSFDDRVRREHRAQI